MSRVLDALAWVVAAITMTAFVAGVIAICLMNPLGAAILAGTVAVGLAANWALSRLGRAHD